MVNAAVVELPEGGNLLQRKTIISMQKRVSWCLGAFSFEDCFGHANDGWQSSLPTRDFVLGDPAFDEPPNQFFEGIAPYLKQFTFAGAVGFACGMLDLVSILGVNTTLDWIDVSDQLQPLTFMSFVGFTAKQIGKTVALIVGIGFIALQGRLDGDVHATCSTAQPYRSHRATEFSMHCMNAHTRSGLAHAGIITVKWQKLESIVKNRLDVNEDGIWSRTLVTIGMFCG